MERIWLAVFEVACRKCNAVIRPQSISMVHCSTHGPPSCARITRAETRSFKLGVGAFLLLAVYGTEGLVRERAAPVSTSYLRAQTRPEHLLHGVVASSSDLILGGDTAHSFVMPPEH